MITERMQRLAGVRVDEAKKPNAIDKQNLGSIFGNKENEAYYGDFHATEIKRLIKNGWAVRKGGSVHLTQAGIDALARSYNEDPSHPSWQPKTPVTEAEINERSKKDYETYHKSFSDAAQEARELAERLGYEIDEDSWFSEVATGGRNRRGRPAVGQTTSFNVDLLKGGKPQRRMLVFQVYGMESGNFELTAYVS